MSARHRAAITAVMLSMEGDGDETIPDNVEERSLDASDTLYRNTQSVQATADVLRAANAAADCQATVQETAAEGTALGEIKELVEAVNSNEQWTPALFQMLNIQLEGLCQRLEIRPFKLGVQERDIRFHKGAVTVSTEGMDTVIAALQTTAMDLEERSVSALLNLVDALSTSIPTAYARLNELQCKVAGETDRGELAPVTLEPMTHQRLLVGAQVPAPFGSFINTYCQYGTMLLTQYSDTAFQGVMQTVAFQQGLSQASMIGFWETVKDKVAAIRDPRSTLTEGQMTQVLPGATALFNEKKEGAGDCSVRDTLSTFITSFSPIRLGSFVQAPKETTDGEETPSLPALKVGEIRDCIAYLTQLREVIRLKAFAESSKAGWMDASRTIRVVKESLQSVNGNTLTALDGDERLVAGYLETLFTLSAWPVLNYLTNLVLTIHAFADYAEASLEAEESTGEVSEDASYVVDVSEDAQSEVDDSDKVDVSEKPEADTEEGDKPTNPGEVPDTGETPDKPEDATGDGRRAVVTNVEETTDKNAEEAEASEASETEGTGDETDTGEGDTLDAGGGEGDEETPPENNSSENKDDDKSDDNETEET